MWWAKAFSLSVILLKALVQSNRQMSLSFWRTCSRLVSLILEGFFMKKKKNRMKRKLIFFFYTFKYTMVSQKFCNILQTQGTIKPLWILLKRSWRWQSRLDSEMSSSPDALQVLLARFASTDWSTTSESTILSLPYLAWSSRFKISNKSLVIVPWSPSAQTFLVAFAALWSSLNS